MAHLLRPAIFKAARGIYTHPLPSTMAEGFYKRTLPSLAIDFVSKEGKVSVLSKVLYIFLLLLKFVYSIQ